MRRGAALLGLVCLGAAAQPPATTILDLQPWRQSSVLTVEAAPPAEGEAEGERDRATLIDLNPAIGAWYVLQLQGKGGSRSYHLENPQPLAQTLRLVPQGLQLAAGGHEFLCALWPAGAAAPLDQARRSGLPYAPLCDGRLFLRNVVAGTYTPLERVTGFLRDHVWGGEQIISFVRDEVYRDAFLEKAAPGAPQTAAGRATDDTLPPPARLAEGQGAVLGPVDLGLDLGPAVQGLDAGQWYPVHDAPGIYLSAVLPRAVDPPVAERFRGRVSSLDSVEAEALDYLVAFDLKQFDLGFALGTDHPRLGWSERSLEEMRKPDLPGPDGIGNASPLARTGMVSPALTELVAAAFTGGFKREHGAFHYGDLATRNRGSHYGFIEQGTLFSTLQPGLATVYVLDDGSVGMKTWTRQDDGLLPHIRHARQNGVPLVDFDPGSATPEPGALVTQWGPGNWSGSKDEAFRTLRAGVCLVETRTRSFLVYGYFSSATPRAMARVFLGYGCSYAMHMDMNALEHTYLAVYAHKDGKMLVQHLIQGMAVVDRKGGSNQTAPRFLGFPDDRDFFYLVRRRSSP
ncbi:MAG: hypothetical protein P4L83_24990 [Nevskia sp.]|nr:hypothetical protein [Nevskia sp.]